MCGRFTMRANLTTVAGLFDAPEAPPAVKPRYNVSPSQTVVAIRSAEDGSRHWALLRWGLVPSWATDPKIGYKMINAPKPSPEAVVPVGVQAPATSSADGPRVEGERQTKQPYLFHRKGDAPFAFADLGAQGMATDDWILHDHYDECEQHRNSMTACR